MSDTPTLGRAIAEARKKAGLSQKQLAENIRREEGGSISPQYLNDIEHDRRTPSSDHMIGEFARILAINENYLYYLANRVPAEVRQAGLTEPQVERWMTAFRRTNMPKKGR
jgi:transcriptional regulator with XRE-family HTH domain